MSLSLWSPANLVPVLILIHARVRGELLPNYQSEPKDPVDY